MAFSTQLKLVLAGDPKSGSEVTDRLVFFSTDVNYLLPTCVAAFQVAMQDKVAAIADIMIFVIGMPGHDLAELARTMAPAGISVVAMDDEQLAFVKQAHFNETHVSVATLARLVIARDLPLRYEHVIYLDGDIQIVGDILPLVSCTVTPGCLLAAGDATMASLKPSSPAGKALSDYLRGIGVVSMGDYFNAGILASSRATWVQISSDALDYFIANSRNCRFHDQSALNAVTVGRRKFMSQAYNFTPLHHELGLSVAPRIVHFVGGDKPWNAGPVFWDQRFAEAYRDTLVALPVLERYRPKPPRPDAGRAAKIHPLKRRWRRVSGLWRLRRNLARHAFDV